MKIDLPLKKYGSGLAMTAIGLLLTSLNAAAATYYIAANGSDSNSGTSKTAPWQHAPGMPNCKQNCASYNPAAGDRIIFRGGDTWHFGDSTATPYTGGTWSWSWSGTGASCDTSDNPNAVRTSCIYVGVDTSWFGGSAWTRPIMTGDNPTSVAPVSACTFGNVGARNQYLSVHNNAYAWFDNFELTGMCNANQKSSSNNYLFQWNTYIVDVGGSTVVVQNIYSNMYAHGWTHLPYACTDTAGNSVGMCESNTFITGGLMTTVGPGNVCDGWDSDLTGVVCIAYGPGYLVYDNVFANFSQIVVNGYHSWHDNQWFNYTYSGDGQAHGNSFESNEDAPMNDANGHSQPNVPFNVFYNNIMGHNTTGTGGDVKLWFCPNAIAAEYQFNNIVYDQGQSNNWDFAQSGFNCTAASAGVYLFNNTVDLPAIASGVSCPGNGKMNNNHIIIENGTGFNSGTCTTSNNTVMNHATAIAQGYMASGTGTSGENSNRTCANDSTPCAPTATTNTTVGAGTNLQSYCNALLASSDASVVQAGKACQYGTADACSYNRNTHTVTCPGRAPNARPAISAWDTGAYQFTGAAQPPSGPTATVSPTSLGPWTNTQVIGQTLTAANFSGTVTWSKTAGALPAGLGGTCTSGTTGSTCTLAGILSGSGTFSFAIHATDGTNSVDTPFSLTVNTAPSITTTTLASAQVGSAYSQALQTSGGTGTVTCSGTGIPAGLSLSACTLSGTPTTAGTFALTVKATDGNGVSGSAVALTATVVGGSPSGSGTCNATEQNADYSLDNGSGNTASLTASIKQAGDLVAITAWCYPSCTPVSVTLGSQTAAQTTVSGNPGTGNPGTGQGYLFYVLSAAATGSQPLTFTATGTHTDIQTSYIEFNPGAGCSFSHHIDYPVGSGTSGTIGAPTVTATAGDLLFNFGYSSEHINSVNAPWSCPLYSLAGETQTCEFVNTVNAAAYILNASGSVPSNMTLLHTTDSWQSLVSAFSLSGQTPSGPPNTPASLTAVIH